MRLIGASKVEQIEENVARLIQTNWSFKAAVVGTFMIDSESSMQAAAMGIYDEGVMDPVCGMMVTEAKARAANRFAECKGRTYFFCNDGCKEEFGEDPEKFLKAGSVADRLSGSTINTTSMTPLRPSRRVL